MPRRRRVIERIEDLAQQIYQRQILPGRRIEADLEGPAVTRRKIIMPRRSIRSSGAKKRYGDPVFTWAFRSSQPRGGQIITYETRLEEDGVIRCNCPGWIFSKGEPATKVCKHKTQVEGEAPGILRRWQHGEALEVFNENFEPVAPAPRVESAAPKSTTMKNRHGRVVIIDM